MEMVKKTSKKLSLAIACSLLFFLLLPLTQATQETCAVYFTGVGCTACAKEDPIILDELPKSEPNFVIIEYEIYIERENGYMVFEYDDSYGSGFSIPLIIFGKEDFSVGAGAVRQHAKKAIEKGPNDCPLADGSSVDFADLNITTLPGKPKIWKAERILIKTGEGGDSELLKELLLSEDLSSILEKTEYKKIVPLAVQLSGKSVKFENAIELDGWIFQWGKEGNEIEKKETEGTIYWARIFMIIIAVIIVILIFYLAKKKQKKKKK